MIFLWLNIILILTSIFSIIYVNKIPKNLVVYDTPDNNRKIHTVPTPLLGGLIFFVNISFNIILFYNELDFDLKLTLSLLLLYSFFFTIGFIDDKIEPLKEVFLASATSIKTIPNK